MILEVKFTPKNPEVFSCNHNDNFVVKKKDLTDLIWIKKEGEKKFDSTRKKVIIL